jgi:hypothetical protein
MKHALVFALLALAVCAGAFDCTPFGPDAPLIYRADLQQNPLAMGASDADGFSTLYLFDGRDWESHPFWAQNFPITGICRLDDDAFMISMGNGSYSDGIYNFDLDTQSWEINEWFFRPNFVLYYPDGGMYYVGERDGLFRSDNADNWTRITQLGTDECDSFAWHGNHVVTNNGNVIWYSGDSGQTWQTSQMVMLEGFRFTSDGTLYALLDAGSDSDGLWRSDDFGATWDVVFWTDHLSCIGPDFAGYLPLGWEQQNHEGNFLELLHPDGTRVPLSHVDLNSPVVELEIFPLINTPSFYVVNSSGLYYLTGFLPVENDDETMPPAQPWDLRVYPNPAKTEINLAFDAKIPAKVDVTLFDLKGRQIFSRKSLLPVDGRIPCKLPALASGLYLLRIGIGSQYQLQKVMLAR